MLVLKTEIPMKINILLLVMFCNIAINANPGLSCELLTYNYQEHQLNKVWCHDRLTRPAYAASCIGLATFFGALYLQDKCSCFSEDTQLAISSGIGIVCFVGSWFALSVFKIVLRWFINNPEEDGLKQTLLLLSTRLKNAVASGQIRVEDLEYHCAGIDSPLVRELIQYARVMRASQMRVAWNTCDSTHFV
jgi:hypothetical protein